jgi:hypothetical protein
MTQPLFQPSTKFLDNYKNDPDFRRRQKLGSFVYIVATKLLLSNNRLKALPDQDFLRSVVVDIVAYEKEISEDLEQEIKVDIIFYLLEKYTNSAMLRKADNYTWLRLMTLAVDEIGFANRLDFIWEVQDYLPRIFSSNDDNQEQERKQIINGTNRNQLVLDFKKMLRVL